MNIRDLTYIQAVAKYEHFGHAAKACNVSQPALSTQIKKLELELDVTLFERDNRSVRLTDVGRAIIGLADEALSVIETIRLTANAARDPFSGTFRLGSIPTITPYLVPEFIQKTSKRFPGLELKFQEDITERLNQALLDGDLDAAILATKPTHPKLEATPLYDEPFWVLFPASHKLKNIGDIRTQDLPMDELLLLSEGHCFRDHAMDVCQLSALPEDRTIRATSLETLVNMVAAGQGVTLAPAMALSGSWIAESGVVAEKLDDQAAYRRIYLTYRKSFPSRKLLEHMAELICNDLPQSVRRVIG